MSDTNPATTSPTPDPTPAPKTKTPRSLVSKRNLDDIKFARDIAAAAQDTNYVAKLTAPDGGAVDPAAAAGILTDANTAENQLAPKIYDAEDEKKTKTQTEQNAFIPLLAAVRKMQDGARRKFENDPAKLDAYYIGRRKLGIGRAQLEVQIKSMLDKAATDNLPGITPAVLATYAALLTAWTAADDIQRAAEKKLADAYDTYKKLVDSINARVRDIRLAANSCWPYTDKANAVPRRAFALNPDKPFLG